MGGYDDKRIIIVGGEEWTYQTHFNDSGQDDSVRLFDAAGEFVTVFFNRKDMMDYLSENAPESRIEALRAIKRFHNASFCEENEHTISAAEKQEMRATVIKRLAMLKGDMTNAEFGKAVGLATGTVYNYCNGSRIPGAEVLKRIASRCGVSADWLIGKD